jgi:hypothetical protein
MEPKIVCPNSECGSENVRPTGVLFSFGELGSDGSYSKPSIPEYECLDCGNHFEI